MTTHPDLSELARDEARAKAIVVRMARGEPVTATFIADVEAVQADDPSIETSGEALYRAADELAAERAATRAEGRKMLADPRVKGREQFALTAWSNGLTAEQVIALCEALPVVGAPVTVADPMADAQAAWADVLARHNRRH